MSPPYLFLPVLVRAAVAVASTVWTTRRARRPSTAAATKRTESAAGGAGRKKGPVRDVRPPRGFEAEMCSWESEGGNVIHEADFELKDNKVEFVSK